MRVDFIPLYIDDWIDVGLSGPLSRLVEPAVARLGDDSFYDPFWDACDLNEDKIL